LKSFLTFISFFAQTFHFWKETGTSKTEHWTVNMAPVGGGNELEAAALARRQAFQVKSGPAALVKNLKVFGIACFACLGGLLYGYNQGVFSGVLVMTSFKERKSCLPFFLYSTVG
jgi:hypothetical protein